MSAVAVADVVALLGFGIATALAFSLPPKAPGVGRLVKYSMVAAFGLYFLVSLSNVLEHAHITAMFDEYEDFAEVLFVPLVAYVLYSRVAAERLLDVEKAAEAIRREHELISGIVDTTPAGIVVADTTGTVTFANELGRRMLAEAGPGQIDLPAIVVAAPRPRPSMQIGEGEHTRFLSLRTSPLPSAEGTLGRAILVLVDVTERIKTEAELESYRHGLEHAIDLRTAELLEMNAMLQEAVRVREEFYARMSHEFRTPLNAIIGFTDVMLMGLSGALSDDQRLQLGMMKTSGEHLLEMVNNVLDVARVEAGHQGTTVTEVDIAARVSELVAAMGAIAATRGISLECHCDEITPLRTDPEKLDQIVRNLVSNALKFTDSGGRVVVNVEAGEHHVRITVADTGIGIAREDQGRIFEAFERVETPERTRPEGTGLGLTICRELSAVLGCEIDLESTPGVGTTFVVDVPTIYRGLERVS